MAMVWVHLSSKPGRSQWQSYPLPVPCYAMFCYVMLCFPTRLWCTVQASAVKPTGHLKCKSPTCQSTEPLSATEAKMRSCNSQQDLLSLQSASRAAEQASRKDNSHTCNVSWSRAQLSSDVAGLFGNCSFRSETSFWSPATRVLSVSTASRRSLISCLISYLKSPSSAVKLTVL